MSDVLLLGTGWFLSSMLFLYVISRLEKTISQGRTEMWNERADWSKERKDLISRIQAGNYAEYKAQEFRTIKSQVEAIPNHIEQL